MPKGIYDRKKAAKSAESAPAPVRRGRKPKAAGGSSATLHLAGRKIEVRIDELGAVHVSVTLSRLEREG